MLRLYDIMSLAGTTETVQKYRWSGTIKFLNFFGCVSLFQRFIYFALSLFPMMEKALKKYNETAEQYEMAKLKYA